MIIWKKKSKWDSFLLVIFLPCTKKNWCCAKETFLYIAFYLLNTRVVYGKTGYVTTERISKFSLFLKMRMNKKILREFKRMERDWKILVSFFTPFLFIPCSTLIPPSFSVQKKCSWHISIIGFSDIQICYT